MAFIIFCSVLYRKKKGNFQIILCWLVDINEIENNEMGEACRTYGVKRGVCGVVVEKLEGKKTFERSCNVRGGNRLMLKWVLKKWDGWLRTGFI